MKITSLTVTMTERYTLPHRGTGLGNVDTEGRSALGILTVGTDEGVEGYSMVGGSGEAASKAALSLLSRVKPFLLGRNPLDVGGIWSDLVKRVRSWNLDYAVIGAVDVALWDITGKVAGLPVHRLLGTCRDSIPVYVSSANLPSPDDYAEEALKYKEKGVEAYKIHPHGVPKEDIEICRVVREAVSDGVVLMLDPVARYNYAEALRVGRAIEELGYHWYEEPMPETDIYGYAKLCQDLDIPVMAPETAPGGFAAVGQFVLLKAADILRSDVARRGGITGMMKTAHLAEAFELNCEPHTGGNSINNVANVHVIMATPNVEYFEHILPVERHQWGLVVDISVDEQGRIHAPAGPGLGFDLDWEIIKRHTTEVAS